jgi:HPt (histidine-containing phosphotransfer) domain-containing protein
MRAAVLAGDYALLAQAAHKLKGASANLHIHGLTELAQTLETRLRSAEHEGTDATLEQISTEFERVAAAMRNDIAERAPKQVA